MNATPPTSQNPEREPDATAPTPPSSSAASLSPAPADLPGSAPALAVPEVPAVPAGPPRPFTLQWGEALCAALDASESYHAAAARWMWPVALVVQKSADLGWPRDTAVVLSLEHGRCRGVRLVDANKARAPFVFRSSYANWKRVFRGEVDPIVAMVKGELAVTGSMSTIMMHSRAVKALLEVARTVAIVEV